MRDYNDYDDYNDYSSFGYDGAVDYAIYDGDMSSYSQAAYDPYVIDDMESRGYLAQERRRSKPKRSLSKSGAHDAYGDMPATRPTSALARSLSVLSRSRSTKSVNKIERPATANSLSRPMSANWSRPMSWRRSRSSMALGSLDEQVQALALAEVASAPLAATSGPAPATLSPAAAVSPAAATGVPAPAPAAATNARVGRASSRLRKSRPGPVAVVSRANSTSSIRSIASNLRNRLSWSRVPVTDL